MTNKSTTSQRTKKTTKKSQTKKITETITASGNQPINYLGEITVKVNHGNKTISTKKYSNSGMPSLFKFLCSALAGSYTESLRPCQIKLFTYDRAYDSEATPAAFNWEEAISQGSLIASSPLVAYSNSPKIKRIAGVNGKDYYEVTYHFRVPFTLISNKILHAVGLFPRNEDEISAYYLFTKKEEGQTSWESLELSDTAGNFSVILDWTMTVMNKPTTENTEL